VGLEVYDADMTWHSSELQVWAAAIRKAQSPTDDCCVQRTGSDHRWDL